MLVNLINKYGLMPKKHFPDAWSSESSRHMGQILNSFVRLLLHLGRARRSRDGLMESCTCRRSRALVGVLARHYVLCVT